MKYSNSKNIVENYKFLILVWFILLFHFPRLYNVYHGIALFFGYLMIYNSYWNIY